MSSKPTCRETGFRVDDPSLTARWIGRSALWPRFSVSRLKLHRTGEKCPALPSTKLQDDAGGKHPLSILAVANFPAYFRTTFSERGCGRALCLLATIEVHRTGVRHARLDMGLSEHLRSHWELGDLMGNIAIHPLSNYDFSQFNVAVYQRETRS
jgi:hypothetical protein